MPRKKDINIEIDKLKCVELDDHDSYTDTEVIVWYEEKNVWKKCTFIWWKLEYDGKLKLA